jgi:DNA polymerase
MHLYIDTETYNEVDLKEAGTYRYAETAEVMLATYAVDEEPVQLIDFTEGHPGDRTMFADLLHEADTVIAQNAMFDRNVLRLGDLRITIPVERWQCTLVQALQHALPGSLDELGRVLGLPEDRRKLKEGKKLIQRFCKPAPRNHKAARYTRETHPAEWEQFKEYARQDVATMREVHRRLPTWNWKEDDIALYHLDQRINDRGFKVDTELALAGAAAAEKEKATIAARFRGITGLAPTQRAKVQEFINANYGMGLDSTAKHIMHPIAEDESLPPELREIASLMLSANKSSTAKYAKMVQAVSSDGRFRGGLQMAGASRTRRWAGRGFQGQNLPSRKLPKVELVEAYIEALKADVHDLLFDDLMLYGAAALRGVVVV